MIDLAEDRDGLLMPAISNESTDCLFHLSLPGTGMRMSRLAAKRK
jgi:hypothetical protein